MARRSKTGVRGLYKTAAGDWHIDYRWRDATTGQAKRHAERLETGTKASAAKARMLTIMNSAAAGTFNPKQSEPKTLGKALDDYLTWAETNRPRSIESKRSQVKVLKAKLGENTRLDALSAFAVERFKRNRVAELVAALQKERAGALARIKASKPEKAARIRVAAEPDEYTGAASVNRALATLKHMVGLAVAWGWMSDATARGVRGVKLMKEPPGRVRHLTAEESAKLDATLPVGVRAIVSAAAWSGMRREEVTMLRKDAVDLAHRTITLIKTKSGKVRRVPISDALADLLEHCIAASPCEYVFVSERGLPYSVDSVSRAFARAVQKAGVDDVRFHDTRHTFATDVRQRGAGIDVVQELLGHATIAMSQRYAHISSAMLHNAVAGIGSQSVTAPVVVVPGAPAVLASIDGEAAPTERAADDQRQHDSDADEDADQHTATVASISNRLPTAPDPENKKPNHLKEVG